MVCKPVPRLAVRVAEIAWLSGCSGSAVRLRRASKTLASIRLPGRSTVLILKCDAETISGSASVAPETFLRRELAGFARLSFPEVASALGISIRTVERLAESGDLPFDQEACYSTRYVDTEVLVGFLLWHREPTRWEVER